jgi:hypothetical protein
MKFDKIINILEKNLFFMDFAMDRCDMGIEHNDMTDAIFETKELIIELKKEMQTHE